MPSLLRHRPAGMVVLVPYLWVVRASPSASDSTRRVHVIAAMITVGTLLIVHRGEVARASIGR